MSKEKSDSEVIYYTMLVLISAIYIGAIFVFVANNLWWIFFVFCYLAFFVLREWDLRAGKIEKNLQIKKREDIRINFWN